MFEDRKPGKTKRYVVDGRKFELKLLPEEIKELRRIRSMKKRRGI